MKKLYSIYAFVFIVLLGSCQKEESATKKPLGKLKVNIGLFISVSEVNSKLKCTLDAEDFKVTIFKAEGEEVLVFERASEMPSEIELEVGDYYVTAHSDNNLPAAFENPYYYGESEIFTIQTNATQSVSINCELANTMVSVIYSENVKANFVDFNTVVSSSAGSLKFSKEEIRAGFFQPLPLTITATLTWEKTGGLLETKILTGSIPSPLPRKHYEIHVDVTGTSGSAIFRIVLDESISSVEIIQITENNNPTSGEPGNGDLLITEIMYDPASLADAEGEWFEMYNNTSQTIDLYHLVIKKNELESHIIDAHYMLVSHGYCVLARTNNAISGNKYVYGTDITLNNTGAVLSIWNYGTDGTNGSSIFSVDYGGQDFPGATGASICLDPEKLSLSGANIGSSWCVATTAYNTGDLGTPGEINNNCP